MHKHKDKKNRHILMKVLEQVIIPYDRSMHVTSLNRIVFVMHHKKMLLQRWCLVEGQKHCHRNCQFNSPVSSCKVLLNFQGRNPYP